MSPEAKRTWIEILRQIPTVTILTIVFIGGGWKSYVDDSIEENRESICEHDAKGEALNARIIELETIARERGLQIQIMQQNQVQINGKMRDRFSVPVSITEDEARKLVMESRKVQSYLDGKQVIKVIYVPGRLMNLVVK